MLARNDPGQWHDWEEQVPSNWYVVARYNAETRNLLIVHGGCHIKPSTSQGKYQNKYPGWNNEDPLVPYVISLGACPDVAWHAYKLVRIIQTADYHFEVLECKMLNCLISHAIFFLFDLWDVFEISCVIIFIPIK